MHKAPRISKSDSMNLELIVDSASVELFADGGLTAMTSIFFPTKRYTNLWLRNREGSKLRLEYVDYDSSRTRKLP